MFLFFGQYIPVYELKTDIYIYMCVCVCVYIYMYTHLNTFYAAGLFQEVYSEASDIK